MRLSELGADAPAEWDRTVGSFAERDFYFASAYQRLASATGEGEAALLHFDGPSGSAVVPLLVRPIAGTGWRDATSVYGYAGPLLRAAPSSLATLAAGFQQEFLRWCRTNRIVSVFSRLHPLLPGQIELIQGLGECRREGTTVGIDLTAADHRSEYRESHRRRLRKLLRQGYQVQQPGDSGLSEFVSIYEETMSRVGASPAYYFPRAYYETLLRSDGFRCVLLIASRAGEPAAAALFTACGGIGQFHLGGTRQRFLHESPMVMLFDAACDVLPTLGVRLLHLGGGFAGHEDSLFHFKAGFSRRRYPFYTWRVIVDSTTYGQLVPEGRGWRADDYFPAYRAPSLAGPGASQLPAADTAFGMGCGPESGEGAAGAVPDPYGVDTVVGPLNHPDQDSTSSRS